MALESGLAQTQRFYGPFQEITYTEQGRDFARDKTEDPITGIAKLLFPSVGGTFGTTTTAESNLGQYMRPESVGHLMRYAQELRRIKSEQEEIQKEQVGKAQNKELTKLKEEGEKNKKKIWDNFKKSLENHHKDTIKSNLNSLKRFIEGSINKENKEILFHATEDMISAFFWKHFSHRKDIKEYYQTLGKDFVDPEAMKDWVEKDTTREEFYLFGKSLEQEEYYNLAVSKQPQDRIILLKKGDDFYENPTPFTKPLISNEKAYVWDRETNTNKKPDYIADCGECVIRHIFSLLSYKKREFNLETLRKKIQEHHPDWNPNQAMKNLENFYKNTQITPDQLNQSDTETRTKWNGVIAQLNHEVLKLGKDMTDDPFRKVYYAKENQNDLKNGWLNYFNVFEHILGVSLESFVSEEKKKEFAELKRYLKETDRDDHNKDYLKRYEAYARLNFDILFSLFDNPNYDLKVKSVNFKTGSAMGHPKDIESTLILQGDGKKTGEKIFDFTVTTRPGHGWAEFNRFEVKSKKFAIRGHKDTLLGMVLEGDSQHPYYQTFARPLNDYDSKREFLKNFLSLKNIYPS